MINIEKKVALLLALVLGLVAVVPVAAQEGEPPLPSCGEGSVSGTVVAVDEEAGMVTVESGDGPCTVTLDGEYDHPIVDLLGSYFGDVSAGSLAEALEATQGFAVYDPDTEEWTWAEDGTDGGEAVTVIAENEDGTFTVLMDGQEVTVSVDPDTAEKLREALQALSVEWEVDEDGGVVQPGDEIAAYHDDGLGFGVLVKLYAMAAASQEDCDDEEPTEPCGVTVEDLVEAFQSGTGMGDLFKEYVRPSIRGVGHVRGNGRGRPDHAGPKDRADRPGDDADDDADDDDGGPLNLAGPKDKGGPPDHAGPPAHAGPKPKKPKKNK
jgi:hypothetical protein